MTALEALKALEDNARVDHGMAAALSMLLTRHPAARSLLAYLERPVETDTPVPPTRPEGRRRSRE